jgi:NAD-dependent dihydropyrimidine dehydrogenase PreA subunit
MTDPTWMPQMNSDRCHSCGACIAVCGSDALAFDLNQHAELDHPERCIYCGLCEAECPNGAIELPFLICFT